MSDETTEFDARLKASAEANGVDLEADEIRALEAQLAVAQDARAEAEAKRERGRRAMVLKAEIEQAKREAAEEATMANLEAQYGSVDKAIAAVHTIDGLLVVKKPDGVKLRWWQDKFGEKPTSDNLRQLVRPCIVHPDLATFDAMAADRPIIVVAAATEVLKLGGMRLKELSGK